MKYKDSNGEWKTLTVLTGDTLPIGSIIPYGSDISPIGWLFCEGQTVSRIDYNELFSIIGTKYGEGDGSTTFNVPNLKGRVPVGKDAGDTDFDVIGETGGEKEHILTTEEMPEHNHRFSNSETGYVSVLGIPGTAYGDAPSANQGRNWDSQGYYNITANGGDQPHNNIQPYQVTAYIIKAQNIANPNAITPDYVPVGTVVDYNGTEAPEGWQEIEETDKQDVITDGPATKCGYKIDGKDVYVKRISLGNLPNATGKSVSNGLDMTNITIIELHGTAKREDANYFLPLPYASPYVENDKDTSIQIEATQNGTIWIHTETNRSNLIGAVNIYYINN